MAARHSLQVSFHQVHPIANLDFRMATTQQNYVGQDILLEKTLIIYSEIHVEEMQDASLYQGI